MHCAPATTTIEEEPTTEAQTTTEPETTTEPPVVDNCESFQGVDWVVAGTTYTALDINSIWSEGAQCVQAGNTADNCAYPRKLYQVGCGNCVVSFIVFQQSSVPTCFDACNSETGCDCCDSDLTSTMMSNCNIQDDVPTAVEASDSGTNTIVVAIVVGVLAVLLNYKYYAWRR